MVSRLVLWTTLVLAGGIAAAALYGARRWRSAARKMHATLAAASAPVLPKTYDPKKMVDTPAPVRRYFRAVLKPGQSLVTAVDVDHVGVFNMSENEEPRWKPFRSRQRVVANRPGFVWDARIAMMPGLFVRVHDAYLAGEGMLHAALFGLVSVVKMPSTPDLARGELLRFLAEAAWYPTTLLPGRGLRWEAVDDASAKAILTDGGTTVTALFRFNEEGLIESVRAEDRGRAVNGDMIPTPWEGRWRHYESRGGIRIPLEGEVAWILPEGPKPYWRGRITRIAYEFADPGMTTHTDRSV